MAGAHICPLSARLRAVPHWYFPLCTQELASETKGIEPELKVQLF